MEDIAKGACSHRQELRDSGESNSMVAGVLMNAAMRRTRWLNVLGKRIEPEFNAYVQSQPIGLFEEKTALARWINAELAALGLTLACPRSGQPSTIVGVKRHYQHGAFEFRVPGPRQRWICTTTSCSLPTLQLIARPAQRDLRSSGLIAIRSMCRSQR